MRDAGEQMAMFDVGPVCLTPAAIAEHVRTWRNLMGWKRETLSDFAAVSLSTIERLERGERVGTTSLERVALALGFQRDDFTRPRVLRSEDEAAAEVSRWFAGLRPVACRPFRTQPDAAILLQCCFLMVEFTGRVEPDAEASAMMDQLREWLEFYSFVLSDLGPKKGCPGKREMYESVLAAAARVERRGWTALMGAYEADSQFGRVPAGVLAFFPKLTDPGAAKRRTIFVPENVEVPW